MKKKHQLISVTKSYKECRQNQNKILVRICLLLLYLLIRAEDKRNSILEIKL